MINIKEYYKNKKEELKNHIKNNNLHAKICIFQIGNNPASNRYVRNKMNDLTEVEIDSVLCKYDEDIEEEFLIEEVKSKSADETITGIIVQLPLPAHIDKNKVALAIDPSKDIDGFIAQSKAKPATPQGIITYLEDIDFDFTDKNVVVIGRSDIVGRPAAKMLLDRNCNVTVIHSKTSNKNKENALKDADLIIVATGCRNALTNDDLYDYSSTLSGHYIVNKDCLIFDVGINFNEKGKMVGDCENVTICEKTPVPGGVGLLTRLAVIENAIKLVE